VKTNHYQTSGIKNALLEVDENSDDSKVKSEAESLVNYKLQNF
jgi:hypothetical protein